ncbi:alpha/beta fold hydrolase [Actinoplanes sp. N902-109]|uniref:alpha/beta fold hydrolase n=1 Tax=Actinoplanes sp. (strain N902-109) TaxID=649831 RepID=UPI0003295CEA|nr:alpha/beta hydrolase [Actinoplanes sp. N902-109]AGL15842.1 alpha/beta hydrolase [Actinoplanes sp. N902-109]
MPYLDTTDGTTLFYQDGGTGPAVVLLSSASMSSVMWEVPMAGLTTAGRRCVAYDRRGHGRSDQPWNGYDYDTLADDLAAVLDHLDLTGVTLVGCALGAGEIVRYLARHGSRRVARIALLATTTPLLLRTGTNPDGVDAAVLHQMLAGIQADRAGFTHDIAGPFFVGAQASAADVPLSPAAVAAIEAAAMQASLRATTEVYRTLFTTDQHADLAAVDVPALVVHGDADPFAPFELCGARTAELLGDARLVPYEKGSHGMVFTHAARLTEDLIAFTAA